MCGINGIFAYHYAAHSIDRTELVLTRDHMRAGGPEGVGKWMDVEGRVGLRHPRRGSTSSACPNPPLPTATYRHCRPAQRLSWTASKRTSRVATTRSRSPL